MEELKLYKTFDNKEFRDKDKAIKHEETLRSFKIVQVELKSELIKQQLFSNFNEVCLLVHNDIAESKLKSLVALMFGPQHNILTEEENWSLVLHIIDGTGFDYDELSFVIALDDKSDYTLLARELDATLIEKSRLEALYKNIVVRACQFTYELL